MSVSGKYLTSRVNGVDLSDNFEWDAEEGGDMLDRTTGADNGHENEDTGVDYLHITINGYYDVATGNTSGIRRGTLLSNLELFRSKDDGNPAYRISAALVARFRLRGQVKGRVEWTAEIHAKGDVITYSDA